MAIAKVTVKVKYDAKGRQVVCEGDGTRLSTSPNHGPQFIEWVFDEAIPAVVDGVEIRFLAFQPGKYPTVEPIPDTMILTDLGPVQATGSGAGLRPRITTTAPTRRGYFFYRVDLLAGDAVWATSDPGGPVDNPGDPVLPWPPIYP